MAGILANQAFITSICWAVLSLISAIKQPPQFQGGSFHLLQTCNPPGTFCIAVD